MSGRERIEFVWIGDVRIAALQSPFAKIHAKRGPFRDLAIPTTILLDKDGRVLWLEQTTNFRVRPQADIVLAKTKALLSDTAASAADACDMCAA